VDDLIPRLDAELATFEAKAKAGGDPAIQVTRREGYGGGGAADVWVVLAAAAAAALALSRRS
jgi:rhombotail lipoprotein